MSSEGPSDSPDVKTKPGFKVLEEEIAPDVVHIANLLGPEEFEPLVALSPRPIDIREDVKMLATELFEAAKAEAVRPA